MEMEKLLDASCSLQQREQPCIPDGFCCPRCKLPFARKETDVGCARCKQLLVVHRGRIPDVLDGDSPGAETVLRWPPGFAVCAESWLLALASHEPVSAEALAELQARELVDSKGRMTPLGKNLAYHCQEFSLQAKGSSNKNCWQKFLDVSAPGSNATILDVGCGAGQTLRLLQHYRPAERVGFDINLEALAFGSRLAEMGGDAIQFVRGSAYSIPFLDHRFTHVICRVALNYLHQCRALREMVRVLRSGGYLYCSVEGPGWDLHILQQARSAARIACGLRDLFYGCLLAVTGVQPRPGTRVTGGRAFGTVRHYVQFLTHAGCEVIHTEATSWYLSLPVAFDLVARKR